MAYISLALQVITLGLVAFVFMKVQELFREVRNPVVRHKNQLPNEFKDRLRSVGRPEGDRGARPEGDRGPRNDRNDRGPRPEGDRGPRNDRNDRGPRPEGDRGPRPEGDRGPRNDRNDRGPRPEGDRGPRNDRNDRGPRPEGDRGPRNDRNDRGPRPERQAEAPVASTDVASEAPAAPVSAPVTSGRRPLGPVSSSSHAESEAPASDALAATSFAQPVAEAPRSFGRRQLPKSKPRFDEDEGAEEKKEAVSA